MPLGFRTIGDGGTIAIGSDSGAAARACIWDADNFRMLSWLSLLAGTFDCVRVFLGASVEVKAEAGFEAGVGVGVADDGSRSGNGTVAIDEDDDVLLAMAVVGIA